ncbi:MAG: hypothetical protein Q9183_007894, partial [Haloplaca sp. 2 TL-2023]
FLDFPAIPKWHTGFVKTIVPTSPSSEDPFAVGKTLHCNMGGFTFDPIITVSSPLSPLPLPSFSTNPDCPHYSPHGITHNLTQQNDAEAFEWRGANPFVTGCHGFEFRDSSKISGGTTFVHREEFSGPFAFIMSPWLMGTNLKGQFEGFNADLKRKAESEYPL